MRTYQFAGFIFITVLALMACKKNSVTNLTGNSNSNPDSTKITPPPSNSPLFKYSDSVFYLKNSSYTVAPTSTKTGTYTVYPNNLVIDKNTGAITVTLKGKDGESQTGLRYKINFKATTGETDSTYIIISGITYLDKFYYLSQNDTVIAPVYNCDVAANTPSGNYDLAHDNKFPINPANGQININQLLKRGFFDNQQNASWKEVTIQYKANDNSSNASNSLDIILYYYNTINDVPGNVSALMRAHQTLSVGVNRTTIPNTAGAIDNNLSSDLSLSKPRPPCLIIIGH